MYIFIALFPYVCPYLFHININFFPFFFLSSSSKDGGQVTFRIKENGRGITASDVAKKASKCYLNLRGDLKKWSSWKGRGGGRYFKGLFPVKSSYSEFPYFVRPQIAHRRASDFENFIRV